MTLSPFKNTYLTIIVIFYHGHFYPHHFFGFLGVYIFLRFSLFPFLDVLILPFQA